MIIPQGKNSCIDREIIVTCWKKRGLGRLNNPGSYPGGAEKIIIPGREGLGVKIT